jgi:DnaJ-class molecular chaperone
MIKHSDFKDCPDCEGKGGKRKIYTYMLKPDEWIKCEKCKGSGSTARELIPIEGVPGGYEFKKIYKLYYGDTAVFINRKGGWFEVDLPYKIGQHTFTCDVCGGEDYRELIDIPCPQCKGSPDITAEVYAIEVTKQNNCEDCGGTGEVIIPGESFDEPEEIETCPYCAVKEKKPYFQCDWRQV